MKRETVLGAGGALSAVLAASCCVGPAAFMLFGASVGFLGRLAVLSPLRPFFLVAAAGLLGFSFWRLYLRPGIKCDCAADRRVQIVARTVFWVGAVLTFLALTFQPLVGWLAG